MQVRYNSLVGDQLIKRSIPSLEAMMNNVGNSDDNSILMKTFNMDEIIR